MTKDELERYNTPVEITGQQREAALRREIFERVAAHYQQNLDMLNQTHILEFLSELGALGIRDKNGNIYTTPKLEDIQKNIDQHWELVKKKWAQGFTKLQLTPMAMPLESIIHRIERQLRQHAQQHKLFMTGNNADSEQRPVELNADEPVEKRIYTDVFGAKELLYFPKQFGADNKGLTKSALIAELNRSSFPGWSILLIEPNIFIPKKDDRKYLGGRKIFEVDNSPTNYLETIRLRGNSGYQGETGFTIEDGLMHFLLHLYEKDEVSSSFQSSNGFWCGGNCLSGSGRACFMGWFMARLQLRINTGGSTEKNPYIGWRSAVRLT